MGSTTNQIEFEVPDAAGLLAQVLAALAPGGRLLVAEPRGHVSEQAFAESIDSALELGFELTERPGIAHSQAVLMTKPARAGDC